MLYPTRNRSPSQPQSLCGKRQLPPDSQIRRPHRFPLTLQLAHNSMGHPIHYHIIFYLSTMQPPKTSHSYTIPRVSYLSSQKPPSERQNPFLNFFEPFHERPIPPFFPCPLITQNYNRCIRQKLLRGFESLKSLIYIYVRPIPYFFGGGGGAPAELKIHPGRLGGAKKSFFCLGIFFFSSFQAGQSMNTITTRDMPAAIDYFNRILVRIITVIGTSIKNVPSIPGSRPAAGAALLYFLVYFLYLLHNLYQVQITDLYLLVLYNSS